MEALSDPGRWGVPRTLRTPAVRTKRWPSTGTLGTTLRASRQMLGVTCWCTRVYWRVICMAEEDLWLWGRQRRLHRDFSAQRLLLCCRNWGSADAPMNTPNVHLEGGQQTYWFEVLCEGKATTNCPSSNSRASTSRIAFLPQRGLLWLDADFYAWKQRRNEVRPHGITKKTDKLHQCNIANGSLVWIQMVQYVASEFCPISPPSSKAIPSEAKDYILLVYSFF